MHKYIKEHEKALKIKGGIAIYANKSWRYNDEAKYHYDPKEFSNWKILNI
jgi:hypothetical protein